MIDAETTRWIIEGLLAGLSFVLWAVFWNTKKLIEETVKDLAAYKLHVAEAYVTGNTLDKSLEAFTKALDALREAVFKKLDRIEDKLDQKADKTNGI